MKWGLFILLLMGGSIGSDLAAQQLLPGWWQGVIQDQGKEYKIRIFIERNRQRLSGQTLIYLDNHEVIETQFHGRLHEDLSMNIYDLELPIPTTSDSTQYFKRKFQLIYHRSFNQLELNGYWQERHRSPTAPDLHKGRVFLKREETRV